MITNITSSFSSVLTQNSKVLALETSLQQSLLNFRELLTDFEHLHIESENYKTQVKTHKENCESKLCSGAKELKKVIQQKNDVIQLAASTLVRLSETKNWSNLEEVFKILFGEIKPEPNQDIVKYEEITKIVSVKDEPVSLEKELETSLENVCFKDESISEIEGTPTGRCSPIIQTKKFRSYVVTTLDKTKKKNSNSGVSTDNKDLKLLFTPTQNKKCRNRQSRLSVVKVPTKNIIDITSSPAFSGGCRGNNDDTECYALKIIKKEAVENDDTILPSPTSGPTDFTLFKSPMKFKKPPLKLKSKSDIPSNIFKKPDKDTEKEIIKIERKDSNEDKLNDVNVRKNCHSVTYTQDDSINILHPDRLFKNLVKSSPSKQKQYENINDSPTKKNLDQTKYHDTDSSISLLHHVNKIDDVHKNDNTSSPSKRPLAENINVTNITQEKELQASMSLLPRDAKLRLANDNAKRRLVETVEAYNGTTPRTRAEKRQLPGWACEKCINFFSELHKDNPDMMWKKINECSHHRGVINPERPKTPPGYWNPRWNVPDDTEEFNKRNNI